MDASAEPDGHRLVDGRCSVALTAERLDAREVLDRVRSAGAGALVLFAGEKASTLSRHARSRT